MGLPLLAGIIPSLLISQSFSDVGLSTHLRKVCRQKLFAEQSAELRARLSDSGATGRLCIRSSPVAGLPARAQQADSSANKTLATSEDQDDPSRWLNSIALIEGHQPVARTWAWTHLFREWHKKRPSQHLTGSLNDDEEIQSPVANPDEGSSVPPGGAIRCY